MRKNGDYSFKTLVAAVPKYSDKLDVLTMGRYARKAFSYIDAYRPSEGEGNMELTPAVKRYASHRRIDKLLMYEENILNNKTGTGG